MIDMGMQPSVGQFLLMKLAARRARKAERFSYRVPAFIQASIRLMLHLAGFGCLTYAGFTWNITAGLIIAGVSFFVLSWLSNGTTSETDQPTMEVRRAPDLRTGR